jgi:hypothetical protein
MKHLEFVAGFTLDVNEVFLSIAQLAHELPQKKNGDNTFVLSPSSLVPRAGQVSNYWVKDFDQIRQSTLILFR